MNTRSPVLRKALSAGGKEPTAESDEADTEPVTTECVFGSRRGTIVLEPSDSGASFLLTVPDGLPEEARP